MRVEKHLLSYSLLIMCIVGTDVATAGLVSGSLPILTVVSPKCNMSGGTLNFGLYDPIDANAKVPLDAIADFQISCTKGANVVITINNGINASHAQGTSRAMSSGSGGFLSYDLFLDDSRTTVWNSINPMTYISPSFNVLSKTVYGRIPAGQNQTAAGHYTDTVIITSNF